MKPMMMEKKKAIMEQFEAKCNDDPDFLMGQKFHPEHKCCLAMAYNLHCKLLEKHNGNMEAAMESDCGKKIASCFIFALCDSEGRNYLDQTDFMNAMKCMHKMMPNCDMEVTEECAEKMFNCADCDQDGRVTMCEWKKFCCKVHMMMMKMKQMGGEKPTKEQMEAMMKKMM